jgi:hypothetical protein
VKVTLKPLKLINMNRNVTVSALLVMLLFIPVVLYSHGIDCTVTRSNVVTVNAAYQGDVVMQGASVSVYAPGEFNEPVYSGQTDQEGSFSFTADTDGVWTIVVRDTSGHGTRRSIAIGSQSGPSTVGKPLGIFQKILITLIFIWGCIGTALFIKSRGR